MISPLVEVGFWVVEEAEARCRLLFLLRKRSFIRLLPRPTAVLDLARTILAVGRGVVGYV